MPESTPQVARATEHDVEGIVCVYNHYVSASEATFDTVPWKPERVIRWVQRPDPEGWFVARLDGEVAGWASARNVSDRGGYRFTCETAIYLDPDAKGRGVADALQAAIDDHCQRCKIRHAVAKIIADNQRSVRFHQRHGYTLVGIQNEIGYLNDRWVDIAIMQKLYR